MQDSSRAAVYWGVLTLGLLCQRAADAHSIPIQVSVAQGRLIVRNGWLDPAGFAERLFFDGSADAQLEETTLPNGSEVALTNIPGIDITQMSPNSGLYFQALSRPVRFSRNNERRTLWYWNPETREVEIAPNEQALTILSEWGATELTQRDAQPAAFQVARPTSADLGIHTHPLRYVLDNFPAAATGAYGIFVTLQSNQYAPAEPILVLLNHGVGEEAIGEAAAAINAAAYVPGDFDDNGLLDAKDIALLVGRFGGVATRHNDLDANGVVEFGDLGVWIRDLKETWFGDADLDGRFDSSDLVDVFQAGLFESDSEASWMTGDWNADRRFTSADFVAAFVDGGYDAGPRVVARAVPENASVVGVLVFGILSIGNLAARARALARGYGYSALRDPTGIRKCKR